MKKTFKYVIILLTLLVLSGCHPLFVSNHTKTETIVESPTAQTENSDLNYEQFSLAEIKKKDLFKELLEEARKIAPSDIISDSTDYVVYHFEYKNHTPNISWYDKMDKN